MAKAPAAERKPAITVPAVPPPPAAPEARVVPAPTPAPEEHGTASKEPEQPASPLSSPELGEVARRLVGRRLQTKLWIDESGKVTGAMVKANEIGGDVATLLAEALRSVRFTPARQEGRPVASVLDTYLCFDSAGVLDTVSPECLRPQPPAEGQAEVDAPGR